MDVSSVQYQIPVQGQEGGKMNGSETSIVAAETLLRWRLETINLQESAPQSLPPASVQTPAQNENLNLLLIDPLARESIWKENSISEQRNRNCSCWLPWGLKWLLCGLLFS
jgi:hypothetical protein